MWKGCEALYVEAGLRCPRSKRGPVLLSGVGSEHLLLVKPTKILQFIPKAAYFSTMRLDDHQSCRLRVALLL